MKKNKIIVFTGGGTGGHIYPGLAVADELKEFCKKDDGSSLQIVWIGSSTGMDRTIVEKSGESIDKFIGIPSGRFRRYFSFKNVSDIFKIIAGCIASFVILAKIKPCAVFSKGGFVSVPPCLAAKLLHIPVYTHECDYSPGLATRINSRFASRILLSFAQTAKFFSTEKQQCITVTGNPVRPVFYKTDALAGRRFLDLPESSDLTADSIGASKKVLLILGGSSGARQINELVANNLDWLCERFTVVHQTGAGNCPVLTNKGFPSDYKPFEFIYSEMPDVIAAADIVLTRAGSNSLWECAVLGKALILIPLTGAGTRGDQVENARFFEENKAALVIDGQNATNEAFKNALETMQNDDILKSYATASKKLSGCEHPAQKIAEILFTETK